MTTKPLSKHDRREAERRALNNRTIDIAREIVADYIRYMDEQRKRGIEIGARYQLRIK